MRRGLLAALVAVAAVAAGCGSGSDGDPVLTIYLSVPLSGPRADDGRDIADAAKLALTDAESDAGGDTVELKVLDDADDSGWDAALTGSNARTATENTGAIAYIGELDSGASLTSIPITNQAGLLQVSPGAGSGELTQQSVSSDAVPDLQSSGTRTFGRIIPSDEAQGEAAAGWMSQSGIASVLIAGADSPFRDELRAGVEGAPSGPAIVESDPEAVLVAGTSADVVLPEGSRVPFYGTDAQLNDPAALITRSNPVRLVAAAMAPSQLQAPMAVPFLKAFQSDYGREPGPYAAYGYESMAVVLDAIERADDPTDRGDVADAFFDTTDRDSVLGTYSIDDVGDTTLPQLGAYTVQGGPKPKPARDPLTLP